MSAIEPITPQAPHERINATVPSTVLSRPSNQDGGSSHQARTPLVDSNRSAAARYAATERLCDKVVEPREKRRWSLGFSQVVVKRQSHATRVSNSTTQWGIRAACSGDVRSWRTRRAWESAIPRTPCTRGDGPNLLPAQQSRAQNRAENGRDQHAEHVPDGDERRRHFGTVQRIHQRAPSPGE